MRRFDDSVVSAAEGYESYRPVESRVLEEAVAAGVLIRRLTNFVTFSFKTNVSTARS